MRHALAGETGRYSGNIRLTLSPGCLRLRPQASRAQQSTTLAPSPQSHVNQTHSSQSFPYQTLRTTLFVTLLDGEHGHRISCLLPWLSQPTPALVSQQRPTSPTAFRPYPPPHPIRTISQTESVTLVYSTTVMSRCAFISLSLSGASRRSCFFLSRNTDRSLQSLLLSPSTIS